MIRCNHPPLRLLPPPRQVPQEQKYHELHDDDNFNNGGNLVRYQLSDMIRNFINVDHCKNDTTNATQYIPIPIEAKRLARLLLSKSSINSISNSKFSKRTSFIPCRKGCNSSISSNNNITSTKTSTNTKNKHNSLFFLAGPGEIIEFPIATATNATATATATATSNATSSMINYTNDRSYIQSQYNNDDNNLVTPCMNLCKSAEFMLSSEDEEEEQQHDDKCIIIAVSWGLDDGIIILYRRFHQKENNKKMEWIAIGCIIPNDDVINSAIHDKMNAAAVDATVDAAVVTEEEKDAESSIPIPANNNNSNQSWLAKLINVQRSLFSSSSDNNDNVDFATLKKDIIEAGSMRVTSILPIQTSDHKIFLVISRLGGYLEVISIPLDILLVQKGLSKSKSSRRSERNKKNVGL